MQIMSDPLAAAPVALSAPGALWQAALARWLDAKSGPRQPEARLIDSPKLETNHWSA